MNQQSKSNKPSWDDAPEWANWLACDGKVPKMIGGDGEWWWFAEEPTISELYDQCWTNHVLTKFSSAGSTAEYAWALENWNKSVEHRPAPDDDKIAKPKNEYLSSPDKKRVTLFIDFENDGVSDEDIASYISTLLADDLSDTDTHITNVVVAVGATKMAEVTRNDDFEFSSRMIKISND